MARYLVQNFQYFLPSVFDSALSCEGTNRPWMITQTEIVVADAELQVPLIKAVMKRSRRPFFFD